MRDAKKCKAITTSDAFLHVRLLIFIDCCGFISFVSFPHQSASISNQFDEFCSKNSGQSIKLGVLAVDPVAFWDSKLFLKGFIQNNLGMIGII